MHGSPPSLVPPSGVGRVPPPPARAGPRITSGERGGGSGAAACAPRGRLRAKEALPSDDGREGQEPPTAQLSAGVRRRGPGSQRGGCLGEGARGDSAPGEAEAAAGGGGGGEACPRLGARGGTSPRPECEAETRRPRGLEARPAGPPQPWRTRTQRRWRRCWATSASTRARG